MQKILQNWILSKLEAVKDANCVLLQDPLHLLPETVGFIHTFARDHGFTVIVAATNLAFRELYETTIADSDMRKLLVVDRTPARRCLEPAINSAPPLFYPDFLVNTPEEARINLDLRQFLKETTGDPNWPQEANDPKYARMVVPHLDAVLRAHQNLQAAHAGRFTDHDWKTIVARSALGVAETAFKKLDAEDYWKIGLLGHEVLEHLESLAPEVTKPIREELRKAPAPFCYFADHDPEMVIQAFYLAVILAQHTENWNLLLAKLDPSLEPLSNINPEILWDALPKLVALDREQAQKDFESVERSLSKEKLQFLLLDQMKVSTLEGFTAAVEKEQYSTLVRSLALLMALDNLLSTQPDKEVQGGC